MLIFVDLDGTLIDTTHPSWAPFRDGQVDVDVNLVHVFNGAIEFIRDFKNAGHRIVLVSDSHPRYVNRFKSSFGLEGIDLADKPNTVKLNSFISSDPDVKSLLQDKSQCFFIGDTKLDIEIGRKLGIMTILLTQYLVKEENINVRDGVGDTLANQKMGATFYAKNYYEVRGILDNPMGHLPSIEAAFSGFISQKAIRFSDLKFNDGSIGIVRCLARQEQGACDKYARADKYFQISNSDRPRPFLQTIADGVRHYLEGALANRSFSWDIFTYLTDKSTTQPPNKMKEIFDLVDTTVHKETIFRWLEQGQGSLRERNLYRERQEFLNQYLQVDDSVDIKGKSIIVLDDQLTTGATAFYAIRKLRELGAVNVIVIAMFQMILPVYNGKICPRCGKEMLIKIRRNDGSRFYSCTPPQYGGQGCGYTENIL